MCFIVELWSLWHTHERVLYICMYVYVYIENSEQIVVAEPEYGFPKISLIEWMWPCFIIHTIRAYSFFGYIPMETITYIIIRNRWMVTDEHTAWQKKKIDARRWWQITALSMPVAQNKSDYTKKTELNTNIHRLREKKEYWPHYIEFSSSVQFASNMPIVLSLPLRISLSNIY